MVGIGSFKIQDLSRWQDGKWTGENGMSMAAAPSPYRNWGKRSIKSILMSFWLTEGRVKAGQVSSGTQRTVQTTRDQVLGISKGGIP
jgi:hypothetical protein